ncbi:hypothetical protein P7K49_040541, partial [Saguinus oedipus]
MGLMYLVLESEQATAPTKTTAIRLMVLFCLGISGLASFLSPQQVALPSQSSKHQSVGEPVPLTLHEELPCQSDDKTAALATEVVLATRRAPLLEILWSVGDENYSENVVSS